MTQFALLCAVLLAGCRERRPNECTSEELGWDTNGACFFDAPAAFFSDERSSCGPPIEGFRGLSRCFHTVSFNPSTAIWDDVDVLIESAYECNGNTITFANDDTAEWDADAELLIWNDRAYVPMCPE